jgi:hypothetical protein
MLALSRKCGDEMSGAHWTREDAGVYALQAQTRNIGKFLGLRQVIARKG